MRGRLVVMRGPRSYAHRADDGALYYEHAQPMDAIDNGERGLALPEGVVDRHGGDDEAHPPEQPADHAVLQRHLPRPEMTDAAGQYPGHDGEGNDRNDEGHGR